MVTKTNQNNNFKKIIYPGGEYVGGEAGEGMTIIPGVKPPKGSIRIPEKFARGSGGGGRAPSAPSAADIARRRAEEEARRRAEEEARRRAEEEARKQREQRQKERQERIAAGRITGQLKQEIGEQAIVKRWEWEGGKSVLKERQALPRLAGESEAAYRFRTQQLGGSIAAAQPGLITGIISTKEKVEEPKKDFGMSIKEEPTTSQKIISGGKEFLFGETGKKFVGVGTKSPLGLQMGKPAITFQKTKDILRTKGLTGKVVGEFIPTTPGQIAITGGTAAAFTMAPSIIRVGGELIFGILGVQQALDITQPTEKRIAGGVISGLSFTGATVELSPFMKGALSRLSTKFKPVKTKQIVTPSKLAPTGRAQVIKDVATISPEETIDIQLIPKGRGFGFTIKEQEQLIGTKRTITTSARDLFKTKKEKITVMKGEEDMGLFFTPSLE